MSVVTGEAVALDLRIAQLPSRVVAALIDFAVMGTAFGIVAAVIGQVMAGSDDAAVGAVVVVAVLLVFLGYPLVLETLTRGRTLGKMAMGLRVVRDDGGPITFRHALVRSVVGLSLERPGVILLGLGTALAMFVMVFTRSGKRIGDAWAGTIVLQERVGATGVGYLPFGPPSLAPWAAHLDLTALDDRLALAIRQFLTRVHQLDPGARILLGRRLVAEVAACTTPPAPPGTPGWAYLAAVLAERRRREESRLAARAAPYAVRPPVPPPTHQPVPPPTHQPVPPPTHQPVRPPTHQPGPYAAYPPVTPLPHPAAPLPVRPTTSYPTHRPASSPVGPREPDGVAGRAPAYAALPESRAPAERADASQRAGGFVPPV